MVARTTLAFALLLATLACGPQTSEDIAQERTLRVEPSATRGVSCEPTNVQVGSGAARVGRGAEIVFDLESPPPDLAVWVSGPQGKQAGEVYLDHGAALFLPRDPYPADASMTWHIQACGETFSGTFETGGLLRALDDDALDHELVGTQQALDLRAAQWSAPAASGRVLQRLGGAFLVDVLAQHGDVLELSVVAAKPNNAGGYEPVEGTVASVFLVSLIDNPYITVEIEALRLPTTHGTVVVRDATLSLGMNLDGFTDGRLDGLLDVSDVEGEGETSVCELLDADGVSCEPCEGGRGQCVPLQANDVFGLVL